MIRYLLDTDSLSHYRVKRPVIAARIRDSLAIGELAISVITIEEQLTGWYQLIRQSNEPKKLAFAYERLAESVQLLNEFTIIYYTEESIARYENLKKLKLNVGGMDLRIAAIALEQNVTVVTRNLRDFRRIPGLRVEDWSS